MNMAKLMAVCKIMSTQWTVQHTACSTSVAMHNFRFSALQYFR